MDVFLTLKLFIKFFFFTLIILLKILNEGDAQFVVV